MAFIAQLALVSDTPELSAADLTVAAAALQKQISRDVSPLWNVQGAISPFVHLEDVPPGYWPVIVRDDIQVDAAGVHCDPNGQPFALVTSGPGWTVTASHEVLEILVDPFGSRTISAQSVKPDQGRVDYLVEIADPVGDATYSVNGIEVSDFYTPHYFDPLRAAGVRYSFGGSITAPLQILDNGYITWHDAVSNQWWQQSQFVPGTARIDSLGEVLKTSCGMRASIDRRTRRKTREHKLPFLAEGVAASSRARASILRRKIDSLLTGSKDL